MKIQEIIVTVEPEIFSYIHSKGGSEFYKVRIKILTSDHPEKQVGIQNIYPLDHLKSLFDMLWEDIGRELKKGLLESEDEKPV